MRNVKALLALLLCLLLCAPALAETAETPVLQVHQMNLGCADGYLIRLGDVDILIDGGNATPQQPSDDVVNYLRAAGVDKLDVCIVTHWHLDHCMNLHAVMAAFGDESTVVYSPSDSIPDEIFNGTVTVKMGPLSVGVHQQMRMGDVLEMNGMTLTCIGPEKLSQNGRCNQDSLNLLLQYGTRSILFTGDMAQSGCINNSYADVCRDVDVLKFPHHGLKPYEIGVKALRILSPEYVIVPGVASKYKLWDFADDNGVKFPNKNVYTCGDGHIVILTDGGDRFEVLTQQQPEDYAVR